MSYYEDRIKALEARIEEMSMLNRMKAIPVEAKLMERIGELNKENARLKADVERLTKDYDTIFKDRALLWASHKIALQDIQGLHYALQTAKEGKQP